MRSSKKARRRRTFRRGRPERASQRHELQTAAARCSEAAALACELRSSLEADRADFPAWWPAELPVVVTEGGGARGGVARLWCCESEMRRCEAAAYMRLGDFPAARKAAAEARKGAKASGDYARQVDALATEGCALLNSNDIATAAKTLEAAISASRRRRGWRRRAELDRSRMTRPSAATAAEYKAVGAGGALGALVGRLPPDPPRARLVRRATFEKLRADRGHWN